MRGDPTDEYADGGGPREDQADRGDARGHTRGWWSGPHIGLQSTGATHTKACGALELLIRLTPSSGFLGLHGTDCRGIVEIAQEKKRRARTVSHSLAKPLRPSVPSHSNFQSDIILQFS